ncbi:MAG: MBL fold metallo-hydrolase [Ahrensia sp.]|nr:MBL fold metallo-hydrolase [Ahrensia sp.]
MMRLVTLTVCICSSLLFVSPSWGQSQNEAEETARKPSTCLAIARQLDSPDVPVRFASLSEPVQASNYDVTISFQGHSTYLIRSPEGVNVATDFAGWMTDPVVPNAVTMNQAHSSHYTNNPDPKISHVLRGWGENGAAAEHHVTVGDVLIRNVTTDLHRFGFVPDGNSIFIFETAGLCIGHLGHLHHKLADDHYTKIGRLDVVMVPVDGGLTMTHVSAKEIIQRLRSSVILPMHVRAYGALPRFLQYLGSDYPVERLSKNRLVLNLRNLPKRPTVMLLPGVGFGGYEP